MTQQVRRPLALYGVLSSTRARSSGASAPENAWLLRLKLWLLAPFVGEELL